MAQNNQNDELIRSASTDNDKHSLHPIQLPKNRSKSDGEDADDGTSSGTAEVSSEALAEYIGNLIGSSPYTHEANIAYVIKSVQDGTFKIPEDTEVVLEKDAAGKVVDVHIRKKAKRESRYADVRDTRYAVDAKSIKAGQTTKKPREYTPEELKKKYPPSPWKPPTPKPGGF